MAKKSYTRAMLERLTVVQKFGGTSVGSIERIQNVAKLISATAAEQKNVVVVSAMAGETNRLVELAKQMTPEPLPEAYDMLLASGEQVACALTAMALVKQGLQAVPLLAFQAGIQTDTLFSNARIKHISAEPIRQLISKGVIPVIAGFQGITDSDEHSIQHLTTLGRGGSDTSAVAIAAAIQADRCDIFTDVDGVYTCDPRLVPNAKRIEKITFEEMMELASLGAKVLHMRSVELAAKYRMPLRVLSTFKPENGGTLVIPSETANDIANNIESPVVSAISVDSSETLLSMQVSDSVAQSPSRFFKPLANAGINVDVINKTPPNEQGLSTLSFTVPRGDSERAKLILKEFSPKAEGTQLSKISIVGIGMRTHSGVAAKMFESLEQLRIPIYLITTSEIKVSVLIPEASKDHAVKILHEKFNLG